MQYAMQSHPRQLPQEVTKQCPPFTTMPYLLLADTVLLIHFSFVLFVIFGGLLVAWRRWFVWLHLPAVAWGSYAELSRTVCPLTYLENWLLLQGGKSDYGGGFLEHYIYDTLYPGALSFTTLLTMIGVMLGFNLAVYSWIIVRARREKRRKRMLG